MSAQVKKPFCTVKSHNLDIGITCEILGKIYQYRAVVGQYFYYITAKDHWIQFTPEEIEAKPLVCQTLRDRYEAAQKQAGNEYRAAESRRLRLDRGQRRAYRSH